MPLARALLMYAQEAGLQRASQTQGGHETRRGIHGALRSAATGPDNLRCRRKHPG